MPLVAANLKNALLQKLAPPPGGAASFPAGVTGTIA